MRLLAAIVLAGACAAAEAPLADAARSQDRTTLRQLIAGRADPNAPHADGTTALHWAAHLDDAESVRLLLGAGADAGAKNRYGMTALSLGCTNGNAEIVRLLLDAGADPNTRLPGGETALMTASRTGDAATVRALLVRGADVNAREASGQTALMWAAAEGHVEAVEALIAAGADFRERLDSGFTPFLFAVREGRPGVVRALLKAGADVNDTVPLTDGRRPPRGGPRQGTSALVLAAVNGHFSLGAELLAAGADPNANLAGYTALHAVTWVRKPGAGDNNPAPYGSGSMTSLEFVRTLVEHGADLNSRMTKRVNVGLTSLNTLGATPFFLAARTADAELMRFLASLGADPNIPNEDNATPLIAAAGLGTRSPGEDAGTGPEVVEALQAALDLGAAIDAVDDNGETAMHGAAYKNSPEAVDFLASKGANVAVWNRPNKQGWTPLTIAEGYRFGNFKPSPVTVEAIRRALAASGR